MPIDNVPDNVGELKVMLKKIRFLRWLMMLKSSLIKPQFLIIKKLLLLSKCLLFFRTNEDIIHKLEKVSAKYKDETTNRQGIIVFVTGSSDKLHNERYKGFLGKIRKIIRFPNIEYYYDSVFKKDVFDGTKRLEFEKNKFLVIPKYDTFLREIYGDYMELPKDIVWPDTKAIVAEWKGEI